MSEVKQREDGCGDGARDLLRVGPAPRLAWWGFGVGAVFCAVFALAGTMNVWPPMGGDAPAYFAPAVELARGNSFENTVWMPPLNDSIDGPGGRRYIYHGFLHPLLVGWAARLSGTDVAGCLAAAYAVLFLAALMAGGAIVGNSGVVARCGGAAQALFGFVAVTSAFAFGLAWFGRMESMVILWVGAAALAWTYLPKTWSLAIGGACVVLVGLTSPVCGVMAALLYLSALTLTCAPLRLRDFASGALGGVAAAVLCFAIYPYPVQDWIAGVGRHSLINLGLRPFSGFSATWLTRPHLPLLLFTFAILTGLALRRVLAMRRRVPVVSAVVGGASLLIFAFILFRTAFVKSEAAYNAVVWLPLFAAVAVPWITHRVGWFALLMALSLPVLGLSRSALLLWHQASTGPSYAEARAVAQRHLGEGLAVAPGLFLASPDLRNTQFGRGDGFLDATGPVWFLDQQVATGRIEPQEYDGYDLVENRFGAAVKIFGIPISRAPTGWQYALYERRGEGEAAAPR